MLRWHGCWRTTRWLSRRHGILKAWLEVQREESLLLRPQQSLLPLFFLSPQLFPYRRLREAMSFGAREVQFLAPCLHTFLPFVGAELLELQPLVAQVQRTLRSPQPIVLPRLQRLPLQRIGFLRPQRRPLQRLVDQWRNTRMMTRRREIPTRRRSARFRKEPSAAGMQRGHLLRQQRLAAHVRLPQVALDLPPLLPPPLPLPR